MTVLYHKKLPGMSLDEGYIGIADDFDSRMKQHYRDAHIIESPYTVHYMMRIHMDKIESVPICEGSREYISDLEYQLRPQWNMAWNMAPGGGNISGNWTIPESWISNRIYHPEHGEKILTKDYNASTLAKEYFKHSDRSKISDILKGTLYSYNKWELADAQLAMRVYTMIENNKNWKKVYLINEDKALKIYRNGHQQFRKDNSTNTNKIDSRSVSITYLLNGRTNNINGWYLCTKEEYKNISKKHRKVYGSKE